MSKDSASPLAPEFLPIDDGYRYIDSYRDRLRSLYTEPEMQHLGFDHWKMAELRTYKDKNTAVKHEYLIATFTDSTNDKVHLRIERRLQASSIKSLFARNKRRASPPTDSDNGEQGRAQAKEQNPAKFSKKAMDEVSLHDEADEKKQKHPVEHVAFHEGNRINLPEFVLLACAINECSKVYHLLERNCYWFCYTATEALKRRYPIPGHSLLLPTEGRSQQGTWLSLPTDKLYRDVNIDELLARARSMLTDFKQQIDGIINNPNNKHTIEARKQAKEEARLREEAERRAEEEKRRAEEEARLKEEAESRAKEEKRRAEEEKRRAEEEKRRAEEEKRRAEEEKRRAEEEKRRAEEAERRIAELEAKLAAQAKAS